MALIRRDRRRHVAGAVAAFTCLAGIIGVSPAATAAPKAATPIYLDTHYSFAERAADLVSRMTLREKVQQLHTNNAPAIPRLGVQQYTYWSEGQHGLNRLGADTAEGGQGAVAESPHRHGKEGDIEAGLVDELLGFVDLGGMLDAAAGGRHTGGVLLGGQGRRGNHAPRCAERVVRLPREAGRKPYGEQQAQKQVTTDENDSQKKGPEF